MTEEKENDSNISFFLEETNDAPGNTEIAFFIEDDNTNINTQLYLLNSNNSNIEYQKMTCKELLIICDYYGILKLIKNNKCRKDEIIFHIISFETDQQNTDIVYQRKNMWFYMNEIKNDKFMKKYLLW
jgi:hypothetical protein